MGRYKHVLFDLDGTLYDTFSADVPALHELLHKYRPDCQETVASLARFFGTPGKKTLQLLGFAPDEIDARYQEWVRLEIAREHCAVLFDGVIEVLDYLRRQGITLGVITSRFPDSGLPGALGECPPREVLPFMGLTVSADLTARPKPAPDPILYYLEKTGARAKETLYIGDTASDFACAQASGVDFGLALWGYRGSGIIECSYHLRTPRDIITIFAH